MKDGDRGATQKEHLMTKDQRESKKGKPTNVGLALHTEPKRTAAEELKSKILEVADEVFDRYVYGESFQVIADSLKFKVAGWKLRQVLMECEETRETYANANILRSHNLIEASLDFGRQAAAIGTESGFKVAIDVQLKIAAKLNHAYSDKATLEHTGQGGGPIKLLAMTDEELLKIAAQGMREHAK